MPGLAIIVDGAPAEFVSEMFTEASPDDDAATAYGPPAVLFAVNGAAAMPEPLVATVIVAVLFPNTPDAPLPGAVNVTFTPDNGLLPASFTVTAKAFAKAVLIAALCGVVPGLAVIVPIALNEFVIEKDALPLTPPTVATTLYPPAVELAVKGGAEATPEASVSAVPVRPPGAKLPLAFLNGAVKVTVMPATPLPPLSVTFACKAVANVVLISAVWPDPAFTATAVGSDPRAIRTLTLFLYWPSLGSTTYAAFVEARSAFPSPLKSPTASPPGRLPTR